MLWNELSIEVPQEYVEPISYLFSRYGRALSVEKANNDLVLLKTYLPSTSRRNLARIEVGVNLVRVLEPMREMEIKEVKDEDWETAWKTHFNLLKVGKKMAIKPSWIAYEPAPDEVIIELDPGLAFGTGYHPTTKMCLEALEGLIQPDSEVLDLGTGSGILTIAAAKLGAKEVLALDVDPIAVKAARKNFKAIGLLTRASGPKNPGQQIRLARGTLPQSLATENSFNLVVANISAKVIQGKAQQIMDVLKLGGTLLVSGFIENQCQELKDVLVGTGFCHKTTYHTDDWVALLLGKPD